jgi:hypothetical protein
MLPKPEAPVAGPIIAPPKGPTAEFGKYMIGFQDCTDCHGEDLTGGTPGQLAPVGPNLRQVKDCTAEQFITTLRTGVDPSGYHLKTQCLGRPPLDVKKLAAMYAWPAYIVLVACAGKISFRLILVFSWL